MSLFKETNCKLFSKTLVIIFTHSFPFHYVVHRMAVFLFVAGIRDMAKNNE